MNFFEIEYKYSADKINLHEFTKFSETLNPINKLKRDGQDIFYSTPKDPNVFCRHRIGRETNQLTYKEKTSLYNSFSRIEVNIDLDPTVSKSTVDYFLNLQGYKQRKSIFKKSYIYIYKLFVLAYYICYDENHKEIGRFVEIEIREEKNLSKTQSLKKLNTVEKILKTKFEEIGQTQRIKNNLFEMFGRR